MSRTIIMQGFTLADITDAEKTKQLRRKNEQSQWTMNCRSRALGQRACLKGIIRKKSLDKNATEVDIAPASGKMTKNVKYTSKALG